MKQPEHAPPLLVLVGGAPASGKTRLARELGPALGLPVFSKDMLKEVLFEGLGAANAATAQRIGWASLLLLRETVRQTLLAGCSVLMEANLLRGHSNEITGPLLPLGRPLLIHCEGDPAELLRRYRERDEQGLRHAAHGGDPTAYERFSAQLESGDYEPLDLDVPVLRVWTTGDGPRWPGLPEIVRFVRAAGPAVQAAG